MKAKKLKTWKDYWRVTLYLDQRESYRLIVAAADLQGVSASQWLMRHALRHARNELKKAQTQESDQSLLRKTRRPRAAINPAG